MKVIFIHHTDPRYEHEAITNYIRDLMHCMGKVPCEYWGISSNPNGHIPDIKRLAFKSLFHKQQKKMMPLTLDYLLRFWLAKRRIVIQNALLSIHVVEWALPFLWPKKVAPTLVTIHGASKFISLATKKKSKIMLHKLAERIAIKKADKIICVSRDGFDYYRQQYQDYAYKFAYIPTFVNNNIFCPRNDRFSLRSSYGLGPYDKVVLYAGRFVSEKGLDILLDAFDFLSQQYKNLKLVFVGDGPLSYYLSRRIKGKSEGAIKVWPQVPHWQMPEILNCADVLALPSNFEATPLVVLESLACGVPVVSFPVGDLPMLVIDGWNGYLARERTAISFAKAISLCMNNRDQELRVRCVASVEQFYLENVVPRIFKLYKEVYESMA